MREYNTIITIKEYFTVINALSNDYNTPPKIIKYTHLNRRKVFSILEILDENGNLIIDKNKIAFISSIGDDKYVK
jgi:predicted methyltransferase